MNFTRTVFALFSAAFLLSGTANAQVLYGNLVGNVTDPQQASITGATVSIKSTATGYSVDTKTDDRGVYEIRNVPPGVYGIRITAAGFTSFEAKDILVAANNIARVDAPLKVGNVSETITVGAEAAQLQTDKSDLHTDISSKEATTGK